VGKALTKIVKTCGTKLAGPV